MVRRAGSSAPVYFYCHPHCVKLCQACAFHQHSNKYHITLYSSNEKEKSFQTQTTSLRQIIPESKKDYPTPHSHLFIILNCTPLQLFNSPPTSFSPHKYPRWITPHFGNTLVELLLTLEIPSLNYSSLRNYPHWITPHCVTTLVFSPLKHHYSSIESMFCHLTLLKKLSSLLLPYKGNHRLNLNFTFFWVYSHIFLISKIIVKNPTQI